MAYFPIITTHQIIPFLQETFLIITTYHYICYFTKPAHLVKTHFSCYNISWYVDITRNFHMVLKQQKGPSLPE